MDLPAPPFRERVSRRCHIKTTETTEITPDDLGLFSQLDEIADTCSYARKRRPIHRFEVRGLRKL